LSSVVPLPVGDDGQPLFDLPDELRIDTDVARRVIAGFIRGQLRQAGFERCVLGLSGGIDSGLVAYLVAEAVGPEHLLAVMMPYRTSSPATSGRTGNQRPAARRRSEPQPSAGGTSWPARA
jgi:asparagine synthetase B (glutamine-hydrolysing)